MNKSAVTKFIAALFILLFTYAACSKLIDYPKFRIQLGLSPLLTSFAGWIAWLVPATEITIAVLLFTGRFRLLGLYASFSLMTMFTAYIVAITRFSEFIPCSCGGILQSMSWNQHLVFNIFFTLAGCAGIVLETGKDTTEKAGIAFQS